MRSKIIYCVASIFLFLGLFWMLLPHTYHSFITDEDETSHYTHLIQGAVLTIISLIVLIWNEKGFIRAKPQQL